MLGMGDRNLKIIREALGVRVAAREGTVHVSGETEPVAAAREVLESLGDAAERHVHMSRQQVLDLVAKALATQHAGNGGKFRETHPGSGRIVRRSSEGWVGRGVRMPEPSLGQAGPIGRPWEDRLDVYEDGRPVGAKTPNQQRYLDAIRDHDLVFGIGPAGTGKTYLAVAAAVHMLKNEQVKKVILARPAVEAGERLGFLPGDLQAKVNPYLRPLLDALHDMMDFATIKRFMMNDVVEVVPLAYMRGRTLNRAVVILDEAQNTTRGQMMMFLTRLGHGSKMIVTGDTTQIDIPDPAESGLIDAVRRLRRVPGIGLVTLDERDIVRHTLVQRIVEAYGATSTAPRINLDDDGALADGEAPGAGNGVKGAAGTGGAAMEEPV
jgi:phosphate starvation-inducible PhoH-like protein